ncbi:MAG: aminotransferase class V-fold PLP-dependent enzyme [Bacteroidota bacterium]
MITFFPGPSQVFQAIPAYLHEACTEGILSISHRSEAFNNMSEETLLLLRTHLQVPDDYTILYTTSATECWEIIAQSLTQKGSTHFYSGSFGEKWMQYAQALLPASKGFSFSADNELDLGSLHADPDTDIICFTQNETSNGSQIRPALFADIRQKFQDRLIAVDVTSSINGIALPIAEADIWLGSVQKCFGMPAGLGLMILSPRAVDRAQLIGDRNRYNSVLIMLDHIAKFQTSHTPNVLGIFLLNRVLSDSMTLDETDRLLKERAVMYYDAVDRSNVMEALVQNAATRSDTVITVKVNPELLPELKNKAKDLGMLLGAGYGTWKPSTFRIANFPALSDADVEKMLAFLRSI